MNMIASVDGATTIDGRSGALGGQGDHQVFTVLRRLADVVLVAAGTVRTERYGPAAVPIAVVSRSCQLDWHSPFFTQAIARPIVVTVTDAPAANVAHAREVADVIIAGTGSVDLPRAISELGGRGARHVLCEGGPSLLGQLAAAGLLDELCLTVSPYLIGGRSKRILDGPDVTPPAALVLRSVCEDEGSLFLRLG